MKKIKKNLYFLAIMAVPVCTFGWLVFGAICLIPLIVISLVGPFVFRDVKYR